MWVGGWPNLDLDLILAFLQVELRFEIEVDTGFPYSGWVDSRGGTVGSDVILHENGSVFIGCQTTPVGVPH